MRITTSLVDLAHGARSYGAFRASALVLLQDELEAEIALFVSVDPSQARTIRGLEPELEARLLKGWARYGAEVKPVQAAALREGAATDRRTLGELTGTRVHRDLMEPAGGVESLFFVPSLAGCPLGFVMLGRTRRPFTDSALALARSIAPCLSVTCAAASSIPDAPLPSLGAVDRDLLSYLELGYTSREIALARGTSFFTVRNQLSALYRKLGVANRTEAVARARRQ